MAKSLVNDLNKRVTILRPPGPDDVDEAGQPIDEWQPVTIVWAAIEPLSGRELFAAQQANAEVTTKVTIRYRDDVDRTMKVRHNKSGAEFEILYDINPKFANVKLELMCKEQQ